MPSPRRIFAPLLTAVFLLGGLATLGSAAPKPAGNSFVGVPPTRVIVGKYYVAVSGNGTVYGSLVRGSTGEPQSFQVVGSVPPGAMNIITGYAPSIFIGNANGDLYAANGDNPPPWKFTLARKGAPGLPPENSARKSEIGAQKVYVWAARSDTEIPYTTAIEGRVGIEIFDSALRLVRTMESEHPAAGQFSTRWDGLTDRGERAASGVYYFRVGLPDGSHASGSLVRVK